jgi:hypothetical protein
MKNNQGKAKTIEIERGKKIKERRSHPRPPAI